MVTEDELRQVYLALLEREPEPDVLTTDYLAKVPGLRQLIATVVGSTERAERHPGAGRKDRDKAYDGISAEDERLLRRHLHPLAPEPGFVMSFAGVRMRASHVADLSSVSGHAFTDIPTRMPDYHAEAIEFVGTFKAIEASGSGFVAVELGAGWGSWSVTAGLVARRLGKAPVRLYAVEGSAGKVANMETHYRDNGLDPAGHRLVHAVVGPADGIALFPRCDVTGDWGAEALFTTVDEERPGYERVPSISLATLLRDEAVVDLVHFDVQGAEGDVIAAGHEVLEAKARYLVIGTHSRSIEGRINDLLLPQGWVLENDQPALMGRTVDGREVLRADGTQVWRNPKL